MTPDQLIALVGVIVALLIGTGGWVAAARSRRLGDSSALQRQSLPTWQELADRVGALEAWKDAYELAASNALSDAERQWPKGVDPPRFDASDILVLGTSMPRRWRRSRTA